MRIIDIIEKKKDGLQLSAKEIEYWINGIMDKSIPDYQTSALLMAIVLKGMTVEETSNLTMSMLNSGNIIDLSSVKGIVVDKHSTGGVGDKSTLVLGPLAAACGAKVAKMSGRGLGHTGGTLDKLESIPGYNFNLSKENFIKQVNEIGLAIIGQTDQTVPADKTIYALRDVTATVQSLPLVAASVMSKKIASGADTILLDVKYGEGAFMETKKDAELLAKTMIDIGEHLNKNVRAMITDMNQPLGYAIGNALEIKEAIDSLKGHGPKDLEILCYNSAAIMLIQANLYSDMESALKAVQGAVDDGSAIKKFAEMIKAQGGNAEVVNDASLLPQAKHITVIKSEGSGYIEDIMAHQLGVLAMQLGAGRSKAEDDVNPAVGLVLKHKVGESIKKGEPIVDVYHDNELNLEWLEKLRTSFKISQNPVKVEPIIYKIL
ncbi:MAG: pyrimidine-nucleoside phosphorylase [Erysipelothrix sp.]|nr:pyrimidine-nucleoside phosphorylase [Erysipelothrix sp.]